MGLQHRWLLAVTAQRQAGVVGDVIRLADGGLIPVLEYVQREVGKVLKTKPEALVLDLSALENVTATGMAAVLWARRACSGQAIPVVLSSPSTAWLDVLRRADLLHIAAADDVPRKVAFAVTWLPLTKASQCGTR